MRIWGYWLILGLVFSCVAGWGLSPQAAEKIQQLRQKYGREKADAAKPGFRELAGALRDKHQKYEEELLADDEADLVAAVAPQPVATQAVAPETEKESVLVAPVRAMVEMPESVSQPQILAEKYDHMLTEEGSEIADDLAAVSPNRGAGPGSEGSFGDFVIRVFLLLLLVSIFTGFGPAVQQGGTMAVFVGGGLFLGIVVLAVDLWQNFLPFLCLIAFCVVFPKGLDRAVSSGLGCLMTLASLIFLVPLLLAGKVLTFIFFAFLALKVFGRAR